MSKRKLVVISNNPNCDGVQHHLHGLQDSGWEVVVLPELPQADSQMTNHDATVGLACIENAEQMLPELEAFILANHTVEWIALVPPQVLQSPDMRKLIGDLFHDYHTLPMDRERLLMALGHAHGKTVLRKQGHLQQKDIGQHQMVGTSPRANHVNCSFANSTIPRASQHLPVHCYDLSTDQLTRNLYPTDEAGAKLHRIQACKHPIEGIV